MVAEDKDGKGILDGVPADYELDSLLSTRFRFSAFGEEESSGVMSGNGFVEG